VERYSDNPDFSERPYRCDEYGRVVCDQRDPPCFELCLDKFARFNLEKKFSILHLNVASLLNKTFEINEIVNLRKFDLISLNETKMDNKSPNPINSVVYSILRRDRNGSGGGIMVFVRKEYKIVKQICSDELEVKEVKFRLIKRIIIFSVVITLMWIYQKISLKLLKIIS